MTPILTDERKAAIKEMIQSAPGVWTRRDLKTSVEIDPDFPDQFLTDEMADEILGKKAPAVPDPTKKKPVRPVHCYVKPDDQEHWYRIPETPDYFISQYLRVMRVTPGQRTHPGQLMNPQDRKGHACVHLPQGWRRLTTLWARARGKEPWKDWTAINAARKRAGAGG